MAADDTAYWVAHPELPGLIAHFMAKGEHKASSHFRKILRETAESPRCLDLDILGGLVHKSGEYN